MCICTTNFGRSTLFASALTSMLTKLKNILNCTFLCREFIACAEGGDNSEISLYSTTALEYVASLEVPNDVKVQNFACLQFTCDGQFIIAVTGDPDWMLLCYNVAAKSLDSKTRANMAAQPEVPVKQVFFTLLISKICFKIKFQLGSVQSKRPCDLSVSWSRLIPASSVGRWVLEAVWFLQSAKLPFD